MKLQLRRIVNFMSQGLVARKILAIESSSSTATIMIRRGAYHQAGDTAANVFCKLKDLVPMLNPQLAMGRSRVIGVSSYGHPAEHF